MIHRGIKRHLSILISMISLVIASGCASHRMVQKSYNYSPEQFAVVSKNYRKMLITQSGKRIRFDHMKLVRDSVYLSGKKSDSEADRIIPLPDVKTIELVPRTTVTFWSSFAGVVAGIGTAALLSSGSNNFGSAISYAILPPVLGFGGGLIGHGIDKKEMYAGNYQLVPEGSTYRIRPAR